MSYQMMQEQTTTWTLEGQKAKKKKTHVDRASASRRSSLISRTNSASCGAILFFGNRCVHTRSKTCTAKTARKMKSAIGGGGGKEEEVLASTAILLLLSGTQDCLYNAVAFALE
jgi:hypothetical protein